MSAERSFEALGLEVACSLRAICAANPSLWCRSGGGGCELIRTRCCVWSAVDGFCDLERGRGCCCGDGAGEQVAGGHCCTESHHLRRRYLWAATRLLKRREIHSKVLRIGGSWG